MSSATILPFTLPHGHVDREGAVHRHGRLRAATTADEIRALGDFRVHLWPETYLSVVLARLIVELGGIETIHAGLLQGLDAEDRAHLEGLYREMNGYPAA
jgi:hypothetical protein